MRSNFLLGEIVITDEAKAALKRTPLDLIARHAINDHGHITAAQRASNLAGYKGAGEILSVYHVDPTDHSKGRVTITTGERWMKTTISMERKKTKKQWPID